VEALDTKNKTYVLDDDGFLVNPAEWDEDFAVEMAPRLGIPDGLTGSHWNVLNYIRTTYVKTGLYPIVLKTCKANSLSLGELQRLFPTGYQRGACKLAGVSPMTEGVRAPSVPALDDTIGRVPVNERVYRVNVQGFLIDPHEWDEDYAIFKARELQMPSPLGEKQWQIISYLRSEFERKGELPTIYATCMAVGIDIDGFAELFPSGYHRGAVKVAGLSLASKVGLDKPVMAASTASH
jgi:tRNA 2-thiouridine synthesizing protein E